MTKSAEGFLLGLWRLHTWHRGDFGVCMSRVPFRGVLTPTFTTVGIGSDRGCLAGSDAETHAFQPGQAMDGRLSNSSGLRGIATLHC